MPVPFELSDAVRVAVVTGVFGVLAGLVGRPAYDRLRKNGNGHPGRSSSDMRAEIEFQTRTTLLIEKVTEAVKDGHSSNIEQLTVVAEAIQQAARAIEGVHREVVAHRESVAPVLEKSHDMHRMVKDIHRRRIG